MLDTEIIMPYWRRKFATPWLPPGKHKAANLRVRKVVRWHFLAQVVGERNDGKFFYVNVSASQSASEDTRKQAIGRGMLRLDDFLKES